MSHSAASYMINSGLCFVIMSTQLTDSADAQMYLKVSNAMGMVPNRVQGNSFPSCSKKNVRCSGFVLSAAAMKKGQTNAWLPAFSELSSNVLLRSFSTDSIDDSRVAVPVTRFL